MTNKDVIKNDNKDTIVNETTTKESITKETTTKEQVKEEITTKSQLITAQIMKKKRTIILL